MYQILIAEFKLNYSVMLPALRPRVRAMQGSMLIILNFLVESAFAKKWNKLTHLKMRVILYVQT